MRKGYIISDLVLYLNLVLSPFQYNTYVIAEILTAVDHCHYVILKDSKDCDVSSRNSGSLKAIMRLFFPFFYVPLSWD